MTEQEVVAVLEHLFSLYSEGMLKQLKAQMEPHKLC